MFYLHNATFSEWAMPYRTSDLLLVREEMVFLSVAGVCKTRIPEPFSLLGLARGCGVLRPQWCQSVSIRVGSSLGQVVVANEILEEGLGLRVIS
jgi:hypothetical protein